MYYSTVILLLRKHCGSTVPINELKVYLESEVPVVTSKYKGTAQYPVSYGYGQDFPITLP
jgi:hypothetical protein